MASNSEEKLRKIQSFDFTIGRVLAKKYEVVACLGQGWEGEVYLVRENGTGIERAAKFFYPQRNLNDRTVKFHAKKLHKLRHCHIVIQFMTQEQMQFRGVPISFLVSEYVEGEPLTDFLERQPGKRLAAFQAVHLLHALAKGIECIHQLKEYHGDLHTGNILIQRYGLGFDVKLVDFYQWKSPKSENIQSDVLNLIRIFYDVLGGARFYAKQPDEVKQICCGLKSGLILKKFKTAGQLKQYLENLQWS